MVHGLNFIGLINYENCIYVIIAAGHIRGK